MKEFKYIIKDEIGIHARPAGIIVKEAQKYESKITLMVDGKTAEATRLMAIMGLGVRKGSEVTVVADGSDEDAAITNMEKVMRENL